jgi:hypothetical protein
VKNNIDPNVIIWNIKMIIFHERTTLKLDALPPLASGPNEKLGT